MTNEILTQTSDGAWVPAGPIPMMKPPTFRAIAWGWLTRRPAQWTPTDRDPNPNERRWRRG